MNPLSQTPKHVFEGFTKCCYPYQKFDSDTEREFAVIIEAGSEAGVMRWMKPGIRQFRIEYAAGQSYEPDFVVETAKNELSDPVVQEKAKAAPEIMRTTTPRIRAESCGRMCSSRTTRWSRARR